MIKRKPDISFFSNVSDKASCSIDGCIDFTIQNMGETTIYYGFSRDSEPDIALEPGDLSAFPLYRACEEWTGEIWFKFGSNGGSVMVMKTL
jgi:hypothetical protein